MASKISELGLSIRGSRVERMVDQLYGELDARGLALKPPVYLSDQWGCPDGTPLIGVPFYLADPRLERIEDDFAEGIESDEESMRYLRHEAGHAFNYAYRIYDRPDWRQIFGPYSRPYRERYRADPFSHDYVRHILGWYAQKHPDEDFAESFAVWLTPDLDWRKAYEGWPALAKLEYVDRVMKEVGGEASEVPDPVEDDLPVDSMRYSLEDHYRQSAVWIPVSDTTTFDGDLRHITHRAHSLRHRRDDELPTGQLDAKTEQAQDMKITLLHTSDALEPPVERRRPSQPSRPGIHRFESGRSHSRQATRR